MPQTPRFLITTADERTWKLDRPVIFLGEWCRRYDRRHVWEGMDAIVAAPYGTTQAQEDYDTQVARTLEVALFAQMLPMLNLYHQTNRSERYWRIILGSWLRRFSTVIFNRYHTLCQCLDNYEISGRCQLDIPGYSLATIDSQAFVHACNDTDWNDKLWARIHDLANWEQYPVEHIADEPKLGFRWATQAPTESSGSNIRRFVENLSTLLAWGDRTFVINSYLPKSLAIKLHLSLGQLPRIWSSDRVIPHIAPDAEFRLKLGAAMREKFSLELERLAAQLVWEVMPVSYLEGYAETVRQGEKRGWPKRPTSIFTSNNYDADDLFKIWTAKKVESGTNYIIGQHGNNYGTRRNMAYTVEEQVADKFITWGWRGDAPKHHAGFVFKYPYSDMLKYNPKGDVLLVEYSAPYQIYLHDQNVKFEQFFMDQLVFAESLVRRARSKLVVRLPGNSKITHQMEETRWRSFDPQIEIGYQSSPMKAAVGCSRLLVFSYDSTGMLETLSQNIPTIAFWRNGLEHLRDEAVPFYRLLIDAGILYTSAEEAANKVNEVFDDVDAWWKSDALQAAIKIFCDEYARRVDHPLGLLKELIG